MEASYHNKEFILVDKFSYLDFSKDTNESIDNTIGKYAINLWQKIPIHV